MKSLTERVLLYGIQSEERKKDILALLHDLRFTYIVLDDGVSDCQIGSLLGLPGFPTPASDSPRLPNEMMILSGLSNLRLSELLKSFHQHNIVPIALKAVVTDTNMTWTLRELSAHLLFEHLSMTEKPKNPAK